jgi:hypothetical protein
MVLRQGNKQTSSGMFCSSTSLIHTTLSGGIGIGHVPADEDATPGLPLQLEALSPYEFSESKKAWF